MSRTLAGGWAMSPYENLENPHETLEILGSLGGLGNVKVTLSLVTSCSWNQELNFLFSSKRPDFKNGLPEFYISLVHFFCGSHLDTQVFPNESKKCGGKIDFAFLIQRHVHSDQFFVSQPIWTFGTESQGWVHVFQHVIHF